MRPALAALYSFERKNPGAHCHWHLLQVAPVFAAAVVVAAVVSSVAIARSDDSESRFTPAV